ncbi:MAG: BlaI/MecI/CopY family transcriptional regulator [wastewater metagenome]|nr:BlaI/MecI/CopY family transcriptional regulator [Candidatus Loosdrechtia aerotolerans]
MGQELKFHFNPFKQGLNQVLGTLEKDIMEVLWKHGESSIKDIVDTISTDKKISYSTVITVTNRIEKKGLLRKRKVGKAYFYQPVYTKEQFLELVSKKIVEGVSEFSLQSVMVHFIDCMAELDPAKIEYFSKLIEKKKQSLISGNSRYPKKA